MNLVPVIGLEIHVQLKTQSKMFCSCPNPMTMDHEPAPNTTICPICMGYPGTLPAPNKQALILGLTAARALNFTVPTRTHFDRKHYFYPDLPKGYQISMHTDPIGEDGFIELIDGRTVDLERVHLEEDAGKLTHTTEATLADYNRAGVPLIEIVTKPVIVSPAHARETLIALRTLIRTIGVSDADMEWGHLRCDANISLRPEGDDKLYPKTEIKNLNSFKQVERALAYEVTRQSSLWETGSTPAATSTRSWDDAQGVTIERRTKENARDYRFFPEPDIPPIDLVAFEAENPIILPELPIAKARRMAEEYGLPVLFVYQHIEDTPLLDYAEKVLMELTSWLQTLPDLDEEDAYEHARTKCSSLFLNWFNNEFMALLSQYRQTIANTTVTPENFAEFLSMLHGRALSNALAKRVLEEMVKTGAEPDHIVIDIKKEAPSRDITALVQDIIAKYPTQRAEYQAGKTVVLKFFLGKVMHESKGTADPSEIEQLLIQHL